MEIKKIHFMGIGGAGISAVAAFAKSNGFEISGCDLDFNSAFLSPLKKDRVQIFPEHDPAHLENIDLLVVSPAIESLDAQNPELVSAKKKNIPVMIGEKFLAENILQNKKVIAITGTHGKSTTTAMIGKILEDAGADPSVLVGAKVADWEKNYRLGQSEYFVLEADEYQEKFLLYQPYLAIITAIEMDHPEHFADLGSIKTAFQKFADQTTEKLVFGEKVDLTTKVETKRLGQDFQKQNFNLKMIGDFNQDNATLAFEAAKSLGVEETSARQSLEHFNGLGRRFEFKGEEKGVKVFEDYAHHPTAIKATIVAAKNQFPNAKIWLTYQPHMYSRTKYLFDDFVQVFKNLGIHETILVDIFAARQENKENISSSEIVEKVNHSSVKYIGDFEKTVYYLAKNVSHGDIVIVMGAGDIYKLGEDLLVKLKNKS